ncbi:hypothetical protein ACJX0J_013477, partial [Zea mays]
MPPLPLLKSLDMSFNQINTLPEEIGLATTLVKDSPGTADPCKVAFLRKGDSVVITQFYTKLEEKHKALEVEKDEAEARKKEDHDVALKQLRKSLVIRAKPMPCFYQEGPLPNAELKKEEHDVALKQLRKSLVIRAKPMPSFYQEGPLPNAELKK